MTLFRRPVSRCPACGTVMPNNRYYAGKPWICPGCGKQFRIATWFSASIFYIALLVSAVGCFVAGLRGVWLVLGSAGAFVPVLVACTYIADFALPVPLVDFAAARRRKKDRKRKPKRDPWDGTGGLDLKL